MSYRQLVVSAGLVLAISGTAFAQTGSGSGPQPEGWKVTVYPILAWLPTHIGIDVSLPPVDGGGEELIGEIVDSRFDGAFLGGFSAANGPWRVDVDGLWAAIGGDRPALPELTVDVDIIYGHGTVGRAIYKDLFATAGVRRIAAKYEVTVADLVTFTRKPGVWDPLVGVAWHRVGEKLEFHGVFEGGGFGVGAEYDIGGSFRADWKPLRHFGLTAGYCFLAYKVEHELAGRTFTATQTVHGPLVGIGLYF